jgi:hypothetical protein
MNNISEWRNLWKTAPGKAILLAVLLLILAGSLCLLLRHEQESTGAPEISGSETSDDRIDQNIQEEPEESRRQIIELESGSVTILQLDAWPGSTHLHLCLEEVPSFKVYEGESGNDNVRRQREKLDQLLKEIFLIDAQGREYIFENGSYMISHTASSGSPEGSTWSTEVYLELPPLKEPESELILVIPLSEQTETRLEAGGTLPPD